MKPIVIVHNAISLDGRMDWLDADLETYYGLAIDMGADAILSGSDTILAVEGPAPEENEDYHDQEIDPRDERPLLVVPDSQGRIRVWPWLRRQSYWRDIVVLISDSTPKDYRDYLEDLQVPYIIKGEDRVSLGEALVELNMRFGVEKVRVDSGGTLNGILLRQGLVDEVSVLIHPCLVGGFSPNSMFKAEDLESNEGVIPLRLREVRGIKENLVWVNYEIIRD